MHLGVHSRVLNNIGPTFDDILAAWIASSLCLGVGLVAASDRVAPAKAYGALVASTETLPTDPSVIVTVSPIEIVSAMVEDSPPPLEVVDKFVTMLEDRELELEITVVVLIVMAEGGRLELEVTGGTFGDVVFRAGHLDPASRRTGQ